MTSDAEWQRILHLLRESNRRDRGYASFFEWPDKEQKEVGIALDLFESLSAKEGLECRKLAPRGSGNDPPDCEALDPEGRRLGIEVTELVDGSAIGRRKAGEAFHTASWDRDKFLRFVDERFTAKDIPSGVQGGPYDQYWLLIHCDEPELPFERIGQFLDGIPARSTRLIDQAFLLLSYSRGHNGYPYFRIGVERAA